MKDNYYKRKIYPFVLNLAEDFIDRKGAESNMHLSDLDDDVISSFAALLVAEEPEALAKIIWQENVYTAMTIALKTEDSLDKEDVAEKMMINIINYFSQRMEEIITEVHKDLRENHFEESKLIDLDHYLDDPRHGQARFLNEI